MKPSASPALLRLRSSLLLPSVMVFTCAATNVTRAADATWSVAGPAPWTTGTNWSTGTAPTAADRAIFLNSGQATVATGDAISINTLRLVNGTLTMTGGAISTTTTDDANGVRIGDYVFNKTVGAVTLTMSGDSSITAADRLFLADGDGATPVVTTVNATLSDTASITATNDYIIIGRNHGTATVDLYGSSSIKKQGTTNVMILGDGTLGTGSVTLHDAGTSVSSASEIYVGNGAGSVGNLTVSAGTVTKLNTGGSFVTIARASSTGTITVEGSGKLVSQNAMRMGEGSTANATLKVKGNGIVQVTNGMEIGYQGVGKAEISENAAITVGGMSVGTGSGNGSLLMSSGVFTATNSNTYVVGGGANAQATVTLSGTAVVNAANMKWKGGDYGGTAATNLGNTTISLGGTSSLTLREFTIGHLGGTGSTENVNVNDASTLTVNDFITIGRDDASTNGTITVHLNLNGGTLATKSIRAGGGTTSATNNNVVANGGTIKALADQLDFFQATSNNTSRPYVGLETNGLTFNTNGFNVGVKNALAGTGGLTKTGAGKLSLTAVQTYTGTTTVSQGTLDLDILSGLTGACVVSPGATLSISGEPFVPASVPDLTFASGSSLMISTLSQTGSAIKSDTKLTTNGTVSVGISGALQVGDYPLIDHSVSGAIGGTGVSAFQVSSLGRGVVASIIDSSNVVTLHVTAVNPLVWKGNAGSAWDINTTTNWTLSGAAAKYVQSDNLLFNDTATTSTVVLNTTVNPSNVTFDNTDKAYTLGGTGLITGTTGLTKSGSGMLTISTANTYSGTTIVNGGTLKFGDGTANGSITGPLMVNDRNVIFNTTGTSTISGLIGGYAGDTSLTKTGAGTQILTWSANTYSGPFNINQGIVKFGNGTVNGAPGTSTTYNLAGGTTLAFDFASAVNFSAASSSPWGNITGSGLVSLNSQQPVNGSASWGSLSFGPSFTGALQVQKGRVDASTPAALGGTSSLQLADGSQLLFFTSEDPYNVPVQIAGLGWGEGGYPGAMRAAFGVTANWAGNISLTAASGIMAQQNAKLTITGSISGSYICQFYSLDNGTITLSPSAPVQNSYGTTRINGGALGMVAAGNQYAFSTGPLEVTSSLMQLNGYSFSFSSLTGTGGSIGNYNATNPSVLTVGDSTSTTYAGTIIDGAAAKLGLVKNGTGTLTLTGANTYTGNTTVHAGVLSVSTAFLNDAASVSIDSGAVLNLNTAAAADTVGTLFLGGVQVPAGTYGPTHPTYGAYFTGTGTLVVANGPAPSGYGTWATNAGLTAANNGLTADPDNDGISNLLEFYLDGNPLASSTSVLPTRTLDATYLTLTFRRRDDAETDVASQVVEFGTNLAGWTTRAIGASSSPADANGVIVTVTENGTSPDDITVQIPRAFAPGGTLFARLKVVK